MNLYRIVLGWLLLSVAAAPALGAGDSVKGARADLIAYLRAASEGDAPPTRRAFTLPDLKQAPGRPVLVGQGMQGDRAQLVFARFEEISAFTCEDCAG